MNEYKQILEKVNSLQLTENGAVGFSTSGHLLVDLNFTVPSNHSNINQNSIQKFCKSLDEDPVTTVKWMFYLRDIREGLGERDSFESLFLTLYCYNQEAALKVLPLIPEFGRWKDVIDLLGVVSDETPLAKSILKMIDSQFKEDCINWVQGKSVSLLAKWLPSINASDKARVLAKRITLYLGVNYREYRKVLSALRKYIDVTEVKTCGNKWGEIDYNKVSSNANARYVQAFMRHDAERRTQYLEDLKKPASTGTVMHATNLYPHEVYAKYRHNDVWASNVNVDEGIEALWTNLKDIESTENTMVVCDGSGSMTTHINGSKIMAIDVSRALSVFFSERNTGEYKDKVIEFSSRPRYIDLSDCKTLADKFNVMSKYDDCSNTDIEAVFDLLLETAIVNQIPQAELPKRILIVSDMEFDQATQICDYWGGHNNVMSAYQILFEKIKERWARAGYLMPKLVFWNVNSRTNTIPLTENEAGVTLVSGFSVNNIKMVISGQMDPWLALKEVLDSPRYDIIEKTLQNKAN